jgi:cysteine desulfurase
LKAMLNKQLIYLDYNATTPVDPEVLEVMLPYFNENFANAASKSHLAGRDVADDVETARRQVAELSGSEPEEIVFTSGSTESINLAIKGVYYNYQSKGNHIITWQTEHRAVLDCCKKLEKKGAKVDYLPVDGYGFANPDDLKKHIRKETLMVCLMAANNETGVIQPLREISEITHQGDALFFCDATQAPGKMAINVNEYGADLQCISAHKMYGPKGTGALFIRRKNPRVTLEPLIDGGGHENGIRSGTLNVPGIIGMGKAAEKITKCYIEDAIHIAEMRNLLEQSLIEKTNAVINGDPVKRILNTSNVAFKGIKVSQLLTKVPDLAFAMGSACTSAIPEPSHVLRAMGFDENHSYASARFSVGRFTTREEINNAVHQLTIAINSLQKKHS